MKDKIMFADYNSETGESIVQLLTKWGTFTHTVHVDEEDKDIANRWDGCRFAHYLCAADKLEAKGRAFLNRADGMNVAANVLASQLPQGVEPNKVRINCIGTIRDQAYFAERDGRKYIERAREMREQYLDYVEKTLSERRGYSD